MKYIWLSGCKQFLWCRNRTNIFYSLTKRKNVETHVWWDYVTRRVTSVFTLTLFLLRIWISANNVFEYNFEFAKNFEISTFLEYKESPSIKIRLLTTFYPFSNKIVDQWFCQIGLHIFWITSEWLKFCFFAHVSACSRMVPSFHTPREHLLRPATTGFRACTLV